MDIITNDIIELCRCGDQAAFRKVVQTYQQMVFTLAFRSLCDEEEAKDIVQETFLRVWLNIGKYDARHSFTTWLYAIASRLCLDRLKSRSRIIAMPEDEAVLRRYASADGQLELENREWMAIVRLMAEGLSPKQRLVFTLSQLEGLSSQEVEEATGFTATQVKSNLYVARQTIRERLKCLGYE